MHYPFIAVNDNQGQEKFINVNFSGPENMMHHSLGYGRVSGKIHDQTGTQLVMKAPVLDAVEFAQVVQQGRSNHGPGRNRGIIPGKQTYFFSNNRHQTTVFPDMAGKIEFFPVSEAFFSGRYFPAGIVGIINRFEIHYDKTKVLMIPGAGRYLTPLPAKGKIKL